ncbi:12771_t:CDS:2 [Ambispora gerdemannii]|uniref:12771_t:CDS:1 n=1 Tax=Ambispora gerdemannii TaxID=144530 RepID=A0A9N8W3Y1_9GLOM|nr:12771_t:CDS:2 [Ambispora gerdemannii]
MELVDLSTQELSTLLKNIVNDKGNTASIEFVRSESFVQLLRVFGYSSKESIKPISLVILTKLCENAEVKELFQQTSSKLIRQWLESTEKQEKLCSHSALSAVFQTNNEVGSSILSQDGLLEEIMDCVEFETEQVQIAVADMLSHACSQKACRALVVTHCRGYLLTVMTESKNEKLKAAAAVALSKILLDEKTSKAVDQVAENSVSDDSMQLAELFQKMVLNDESDISVRLNAVEGLTYASIKPKVKEMITYHPTLLKGLFTFVKDSEKTSNTLFYGVVVILANITTYQKPLSEKEQQILKLKKLAGEASTLEPDPLDSEEHVLKRNQRVLELGAINILNILAKNSSQIIRQSVAQVFLNLSTDQKNRGAIVQQGGVKSLIPLTTNGTQEGTCLASQALAKIAITTDPSLAFRGERAVELVTPFLTLCKGENELFQFEALMALTNLGSVDDSVRTKIVDAKGIITIENLQFSDNTMIRRAATECLCNMMFCEPVYEMYSDPNRSTNKIKILLALSDVDDFQTRRASSGALAILSTSPEVCRMIVDRPRGVEVLLLLLNEESPELQHRSAECIKNIAKVEQKLAESLVNNKVDERLVKMIKDSKVEAVVMTAAEALKEIAKYGILKKEITETLNI